jgi:hypothetical protein
MIKIIKIIKIITNKNLNHKINNLKLVIQKYYKWFID